MRRVASFLMGAAVLLGALSATPALATAYVIDFAGERSFMAPHGVQVGYVETGTGRFELADDATSVGLGAVSAFSFTLTLATTVQGAFGSSQAVDMISYGLADLVRFNATQAGQSLSTLTFATQKAQPFGGSLSASFSGIGAPDGSGSDFSPAGGGVIGLYHITAVPEPATWTCLVAGFGLVGAASRHGRRKSGRGVPA